MKLEDVDLFDPKTQENWFPAYETLLEESPVYQVPGTTVYVVCKYNDII